MCRYITMGRLKSAPSYGDLDPHLINGSVGSPECAAKMASRLVHPFLHSSPVSEYTQRHTNTQTTSVVRDGLSSAG